jgi:hypothetical protein
MCRKDLRAEKTALIDEHLVPMHYSRPRSPTLPRDSPDLNIGLTAATHFLDDGGRTWTLIGVDTIRCATFRCEQGGVERAVHG